MSHRYFSATPLEGPAATLTGPEAHHLLHVLRGKPGDAVVLFDGSGREFAARVVACERAAVELSVEADQVVDRELATPLTLGAALPKGDRARWLVEKAVELGVSRLAPLITQRTEIRRRASDIERLGRTVIEASKQCGRNRLMTISEPCAWTDWLNDETCPRRLVGHPGGDSLRAVDLSSAAPTAIGIGPEGGLTDGEVAAAREAGWSVVDLGKRILRVETAAIALAGTVALGARRP